MRDELTSLIRLAELDASARDLDEELAKIPDTLGDMRANVEKLEALLARERDQLNEARTLQQQQQAQIEESQEALTKARGKTTQATNAREADAARREVEAVKRTLKDREDEALKLTEAIEKVAESVAQHEKEFGEFKAMFEAEDEQANARLRELESERAKVLEGRDDIVAKIPKTIVRRYDRIRKQRGSGVSEVRGGDCTACRMQVPSQQLLRVQRFEDWEQCQNCNRILFWKSGENAGDEAPATP